MSYKNTKIAKTDDTKGLQSNEIWLNAQFDATKVLEVRTKIIDASTKDESKPIMVYINSYGGNVDALNVLVDTFESVPNKIVTIGCGTTMSAGAVLLSAGDERYVTKNSRVMIHKVSTMSWGNADDIKNEAEETARLNDQLMTLLARNCGKTINQLNRLFKEKREIYLSADDSMRFGLVDHVGFPRLVESTSYSIKLF